MIAYKESEAEFWLTEAESLYQSGRPAEVLTVLQKAPSGMHTGEKYLLLLGASLARLRRKDEARSAFERLLQINPDCYDALTWMAVLKRNSTEVEEALQYAKRAIRLRPNDPLGYSSLGSCFLFLRQPVDAIQAFTQATHYAPDIAEHQHNLGQAFLMDHQHGEAIVRFRRAIELAPADAHSYLTLARVYMLYGMAGEALACIESGLAVLPACAELHTSAASAFALIRNDSAAERHHRRAVELSPGAKGEYAAWLLNQGRFEESGAIFRELTQQGGDPAYGYYGLMQSKKVTAADEPFVAEMRTALERGPMRKGSQMYLRYALGRAEEQLKRGEEAMRHFDAANALAYEINHSAHPVNPASFSVDNRNIQSLYQQLIESKSESKSLESPIFIIGMIRSGTTLLDQIVSSHPAVASAGELRFWIEEALRLAANPGQATPHKLNELAETYLRFGQLLIGSETRFTDKMPLNFAYVGIIRAAFPNAKFLHIRRHPVDTALSIYTTYFGKGALFAYNKSNIVSYYRSYLEAMDFWRSVMPADSLFELNYEDLVSQPEIIIPKVIEFCGLPWDDACLRPHENQSAINTPSRWQARQPMYKTSTDRWRLYEPWLGEFAELLG